MSGSEEIFNPEFDYVDYLRFVGMATEGGLLPPPIMSTHLKSLMKKRVELKKLLKLAKEGSLEFMSANIAQASTKLVTLSSYGVTGYRGMRCLDPDFFNAVTGMARHILTFAMGFIQNRGYEVIYGDTDSVFLKRSGATPLRLVGEIEHLTEEVNKAVKEHLIQDYKVDPEVFMVELEPKNVYDTLIFTSAKKKYRGVTCWVEGDFDKKVDLMGFEAKRSDAFLLMQQVQLKLQEIITDPTVLNFDEVITNYLSKVKEEMYGRELDSFLIQTKSVRKDLKDYAHDDPHTRVAKKLKENVRTGDRVSWVVVRKNKDEGMIEGPIDPEDKFSVPSIEKSGYDYYWERLMKMVERLLGKKEEEDVQPRMDQFLTP